MRKYAGIVSLIALILSFAALIINIIVLSRKF